MNKTMEEILNQFTIYGHSQEPFICARCGSQTGDDTEDFCWCTDKDTSNWADSPTWIENINYPRYIEARAEATKDIEALITKAVVEERERVVVDYTDFLIKYGYVDSDVYTEEPKAVERYLSSLDKPLKREVKDE